MNNVLIVFCDSVQQDHNYNYFTGTKHKETFLFIINDLTDKWLRNWLEFNQPRVAKKMTFLGKILSTETRSHFPHLAASPINFYLPFLNVFLHFTRQGMSNCLLPLRSCSSDRNVFYFLFYLFVNICFWKHCLWLLLLYILARFECVFQELRKTNNSVLRRYTRIGSYGSLTFSHN